MIVDNWAKKAQAEIEKDAKFAVTMCEATAENEKVELYWVIEQFIKTFCKLAKDGE